MDALAFHLLLQLVKRGDLDQDDLDAIADRLEAEGEADAAHAVLAAPFEADETGETGEAEFRRARMRLVASRPDGGNEAG